MLTEENKALARRFTEEIRNKIAGIWSKCNDLALNIETLPDPSTLAMARRTSCSLDQNSKSKYADGIIYTSTNYWYLRKTVRLLAPSPDDVVYDLGCGKGRFLCVMAQRPVRRCVGIDLSPSLCEIARTNARRLRGRKTEIEIVCADCSDADLHDGTIYYMFNPFGPRTMCAVLENIYRSLVSNPRRITIAYQNPAHEEVLESCRWLELFEGFETFRGQRASFWRNRKIPLPGGLPAGIARPIKKENGK